MKPDKNIIDKVLNNTASPDEAKQIANWFATDEGQAYLSHRLASESAEIGEEEIDEWTKGSIPTDRMQKRFLEQIKPRHQSWKIWKAVAVIIPFLLLSTALGFLADKTGIFSETQYVEIVVPYGERMQVILQDGTTVELNSATTLRYPKQFGLFSRKVELYGEGYFKVEKETSRPFSVETKHLKIAVTGTQFNVKAYPEDSRIFVTLDEGGVLLKGAGDKEYHLIPGEMAVYDWQSGKCGINRPEDIDSVKAWRTNSLNFYMAPLRDIIKVMERQYDTRFIINDSTLLDSKYTLSTSKVNVADVLHDLEMVSRIEFVEVEENTFEIRIKQ
ncbi:FecR family protein [Bacteroides sp. 51]|uniref:FecR family protein n=1 Tax=Bacteroides sp. 51 TaxID=2302938 RepID=UPI0013D31617|nr:FecR family protein [Bacteroides sp. 51]NDV84022.1 FecR family protein [Bacteroides sp. 51]